MQNLKYIKELRKWNHYDDYIMVAEVFIADFEEVIQCKQWKYWKDTMNLKFSSLAKNDTYGA